MGRLINADAIVHYQTYDDEHEEFSEHESTIEDFLDEMTDEGCPNPVDAVPVRHGHWVKWYEEVCDSFGVGYAPHYKCSECDTEYDQYDAMRMNYCPNCGVRLIEDIDGRGEQHER